MGMPKFDKLRETFAAFSLRPS